MLQAESVKMQDILGYCHAAEYGLSSGFQTIQLSFDCDADLSDILHKVTIVTQNLNIINTPKSEIIPMKLRKALRSIQYDILAGHIWDAPDMPTINVLKTLRLGIAIYAGIIQNDFMISPMSSQFTDELKSCLRSEGPKSNSTHALRLWCIFLAFSLDIDTTETSIFLDLAIQIISDLSLASWAEVKELLVSFAWVGKLQDTAGQATWNAAAGIHLVCWDCELHGARFKGF